MCAWCDILREIVDVIIKTQWTTHSQYPELNSTNDYSDDSFFLFYILVLLRIKVSHRVRPTLYRYSRNFAQEVENSKKKNSK